MDEWNINYRKDTLIDSKYLPIYGKHLPNNSSSSKYLLIAVEVEAGSVTQIDEGVIIGIATHCHRQLVGVVERVQNIDVDATRQVVVIARHSRTELDSFGYSFSLEVFLRLD